MSAGEIAWRLRYRGTLARERGAHATGKLAPSNRLQAAVFGDSSDWRQDLLASRKRHAGRFLPPVGQRASMVDLFKGKYAAELAATRVWASNARERRFEFFGRQFSYGPHIPWQSDPVSGRPWPALYHADVPVHGGNVGYGDVKYVWELSRQQFVVDLGKAWFLDRTDEDLHSLRALVRSWIAGNPYATGVNWACALEPAFRVFSWLWGYYLCADGLDDEFHLEWLTSFHDHGRFIERHLEHYSSPYNHLIAEGAALFMLGACFPEFRDAERWCSTGLRVMTGRLADQFYRDGGSVEQSTFYHHATTGFYLLAMLTARATGRDFPGTVIGAVERALDFSLTLMQPDGTTPAIGGADDGKPIRMEHLPFWDFRPYLATGAVLFAREDFKRAAGRFFEDALWLLGPEGCRAFDAIVATPGEQPSRMLRESGYCVLRKQSTQDADYVSFDCGEQAAGMRTDDVPNSMHGHADCLSVVVWLKGKRTLVDSGLFGYNCGGQWEDHFRETAAHNTARVDGKDQARHLRKMAWSHSYRATFEGFADSRDGCWVLGSHDGYERGPDGIRHRRAAWLRSGHYLLIYDEFVGSGRHTLEVNYQFAPGRLVAGEGRAAFDDAIEMVWTGNASWTARSESGGDGPQDGWIAPSLGVRVAAPRLTLECHTSAPRTSLLTVLAATDGGGRRVAVRPRDEAGTPCNVIAVRTGSGVDWIAAWGLGHPAPIDSDGLLAVVGGKTDSHHVGGTRATADHGWLGRLAKSPDVAEILA
jgi:hypothetical protein